MFYVIGSKSGIVTARSGDGTILSFKVLNMGWYVVKNSDVDSTLTKNRKYEKSCKKLHKIQGEIRSNIDIVSHFFNGPAKITLTPQKSNMLLTPY